MLDETVKVICGSSRRQSSLVHKVRITEFVELAQSWPQQALERCLGPGVAGSVSGQVLSAGQGAVQRLERMQ